MSACKFNLIDREPRPVIKDVGGPYIGPSPMSKFDLPLEFYMLDFTSTLPFSVAKGLSILTLQS